MRGRYEKIRAISNDIPGHKRGLRMRPEFIAIRDSEGYEVRHYAEVVRLPNSGTNVCGPPESTYIVGKSGRQQIATANNSNISYKLLQISGPEQLAEFMSQYGPLGVLREPEKRYECPWNSLKELVDFLRGLAEKAEAYDREGFMAQALHRALMVQQLGFVDLDKGNRRAVVDLRVEFPCLADYLIWQMYNTLDERGEHLGRRVAKICAGCPRVFFAGGVRQKGSRRADAKYHNDLFRDAARKRRRRKRP